MKTILIIVLWLACVLLSYIFLYQRLNHWVKYVLSILSPLSCVFVFFAFFKYKLTHDELDEDYYKDKSKNN